MPLSPADLSTLSRLLDEALDLAPAQVEAWLAALPEVHAHLQPRLREMLAEHLAQGRADFMADGPRLSDEEPPADESVARAGDLVGPYRLIREIGRGGMGAVWLAERADGSVRRKVALKLPHVTWSSNLGERFAREREILSSLEHVNIARMYDAGVDQHGRPFMALEFVEGLPIDEFCSQRALATEARLKLLLQVAEAVAYAHGRLVLHRDLKPGNILVTHDGQVRLLDFGIAKLMEGGKAAATALTQRGGRALTLDYASPEQIRGEPVGTASDVYSLGVVAFELLAGERPYRLKRGSAAELEEAIVEQDLPLASAVAQTPALRQALRGDLDAILNKALKKPPGERYGSIDALALDWRHHLDGQRVDARPDTLAYRATRLLRRHRWSLLPSVLAVVAILLALGVGATGLVTLTLVAGLGAALWQARRAGEQARRANEAAAVAQLQTHRAAAQSERARLATEFVAEIFRVSARSSATSSIDGTSRPAEPVLDQGAKLILARFPGQPDMQAELYGVVGRIYADIGANHLAIDYARRQISLLDALPPDRARRARALMLLANACLDEGMDADAEAYAQPALETTEPDDTLRPDALVLLGRVQLRNGKGKSAQESLSKAERLLADRGISTGAAVAWLQWSKIGSSDDFEQTRINRQRALQTALNSEGPESPTAIEMRIELSHWLTGIHQFDESRSYIEAALSVLRSMGGVNDIRASVEEARYWSHLCAMVGTSHAEAVAAIQRSRAVIASSLLPIPAVVLAKIDYQLALTERNWGALEEAERLMSTSVPILLGSSQSVDVRFDIIGKQSQLAVLMGLHDTAESLMNERLSMRRELGRALVPFAAFDWGWAAMNMAMKGEYDRAEELLSTAPSFGIRRSDPVAGDVFARMVPLTHARIRLMRGDAQGAAKVLPDLPAGALPDEEGVFAERALHGELHCALGETAEGLPRLLESIRTISALVGEQEPGLARLRAVAGLCALADGNREQALQLAALARKAFTAQPLVSTYFKAPLLQLDKALGNEATAHREK